jgi:hypothetical protein
MTSLFISYLKDYYKIYFLNKWHCTEKNILWIIMQYFSVYCISFVERNHGRENIFANDCDQTKALLNYADGNVFCMRHG